MAAENYRATIYLESVNYSEATSIRSISGEWDDRISSGDDALSYSRAYIGAETDIFTIQFLQRFETIYEFDNDTARFIYQVENQRDLIPGETYKLDIRPREAHSEGIRIGFKNLVLGDLSAGIFLSLLKPFELTDGSLSGSAVAIGPNDYDFDFSSDLFYEHDPLYGRDSEELSGNGYALDLYFDYAINERWQAKLELVDIVGKLSFDDAPFTTADASSDIKNFDENGYVVFDPVVRGIEGNKDYDYEFDPRTHIGISYLLTNRYRLQVLHHDYKNAAYQEIQLNQATDHGEISWQIIPEPGALGIAYTTSDFMFGFAADDLDSNKMKYLSLHARYSWSFQ